MTKAYPSIERNDLILVQEIASYMLLAHGAVYVILVREFWMFICVDILYNWLNNSEILAIKSYRTFMPKFSHLLFGNLSQLLTNHTCSQLHSNMNELNVCSTRSDFSNTFLNSIMIIHEVCKCNSSFLLEIDILSKCKWHSANGGLVDKEIIVMALEIIVDLYEFSQLSLCLTAIHGCVVYNE